MRPFVLYHVISFLGMFPLIAFAQDIGLYAPAPPANAAFVRIIHASSDTSALAASIGEVSYGELVFATASPYRAILQGQHTLAAENLSQDLEITAGKFYTLAVTPNGVVTLEDATSTNRAKALLLMYNLSDIASVDLKTADGKTEVFTGIAPNTQKGIEVNGITVDLLVSREGSELQAFPGVSLERGAAYSALVLGTAENPTVIWVQSETTTE